MRTLLLLLLTFITVHSADKACPGFQGGVEAYKAEKYPEALSAWEPCTLDGFQNVDLYYDLGNAYYRQNQVGKAVWAYESALRLDPTNEDAIANLNQVRTQTVDKTETTEENPVLKALWRAHHALGINAQLKVLVAMAWLAGLLLILGIWFHRNMVLRTVLYAGLFSLGVVGFTLVLDVAFKIHGYETEKSAVVVAKSADVMSGPGDKYQVLHELHEGTLVELREEREGWASVRLGDNVNGFVKASQVLAVQ